MSNTSPSDTAVRIAQTLAVPAAGAVAGLIGCMSFATIPALTLAPGNVAARQWNRVFEIGAYSMPPMVVLIAAHFGYLAQKTRRLPGLFPQLSFDPTAPRILYSVAAVLSVAIVPFTVLRMSPTNSELRANAVSKRTPTPEAEAKVRALLTRWGQMNYVRAALVGTGALLAALATTLTV